MRENPDGRWTHPDSNEKLQIAGIVPIEKCIERRKVSLRRYSQTRPVFNRCLETKPLASNINQLTWWNSIRKADPWCDMVTGTRAHNNNNTKNIEAEPLLNALGTKKFGTRITGPEEANTLVSAFQEVKNLGIWFLEVK